ncbi:MAG: GTP pyrophosphokinase family protein [Ornithinimicrobium sp.]
MNGMDLSLVEIEVRSGAPVTRQEFAQSTVGRKALSRFLMGYRGALEEMLTKIKILKDEFEIVHDYSPIEHVSSRMKSPESLMAKVDLRGLPHDFTIIRDNIFDIAGIRITCSFISDIYTLADMLTDQKDVEVLQVKDYVAHPKANGYKSLHLILSVPVFLSDRVEEVPVELQIRTVAMDFWASLEHKIYYKFDRDVPAHIVAELKQAAEVANNLDRKMESLRTEVDGLQT